LCADPANLPFSSNDPAAVRQGAPGLYVEIGQAVADALGRPMETVWSLSYFGKRNMRTTMLAGLCDFAVGLPAIPDFMGPAIIISRPILDLGYALVLPKGQAATLANLKGRRVAVQFASPPQSLLATHDEIHAVTVMDPEEGMRKLAAGEVDAAFLWAPTAGYVNHTQLNDRFDVVAVRGPQMQFQAAIGFARASRGLRDQVDAVLPGLAPRLHALIAKYAVAAAGDPVTLAASPAAAPAVAAVPAMAAAPRMVRTSDTGSVQGDPVQGKEIFNGTCAHCHGPDAIVEDRRINLRRLHHKYGDQMSEVFFTTVTHGRPDKGMPNWSAVFSHDDFVNILAYLRTVQEK
ncbi:MAG: transporter substrate-binding domain-containing protein, partial [Burkholderiales bacterium]|nr:transporter substrate-binding domain-containing protein [Burkholderiales bacterium]